MAEYYIVATLPKSKEPITPSFAIKHFSYHSSSFKTHKDEASAIAEANTSMFLPDSETKIQVIYKIEMEDSDLSRTEPILLDAQGREMGQRISNFVGEAIQPIAVQEYSISREDFNPSNPYPEPRRFTHEELESVNKDLRENKLSFLSLYQKVSKAQYNSSDSYYQIRIALGQALKIEEEAQFLDDAAYIERLKVLNRLLSAFTLRIEHELDSKKGISHEKFKEIVKDCQLESYPSADFERLGYALVAASAALLVAMVAGVASVPLALVGSAALLATSYGLFKVTNQDTGHTLKANLEAESSHLISHQV